MTDIVVTGVVHNNSAEWLIEDIYNNSINLDYQSAIADWESLGWHSKEEVIEFYEGQPSDTILIGFIEVRSKDDAWYQLSDGHMFGIDPAAEYSAIVGECYCQVVRSGYAQQCRLCSPCYPGQGNLDEPDPDGQVLTYSLPPGVWGANKPDNLVRL